MAPMAPAVYRGLSTKYVKLRLAPFGIELSPLYPAVTPLEAVSAASPVRWNPTRASFVAFVTLIVTQSPATRCIVSGELPAPARAAQPEGT